MLRWKVECPMPGRTGRSRKEGGMDRGREGRKRERGMHVSPCIILRSFEKPKATTGCVTLVALPIGT